MLGRKIVIQFGGYIIFSFLTFISLTLVARFFGPGIMGEISYYSGILGLILMISDFGLSRAHIKLCATGKNLGEKIGVFVVSKSSLLAVSFIIALVYFLFFLRFASPSYKTAAFLIILFNEMFSRTGSSILLTFESLQMITIENTILAIGKVVKIIGLLLLLNFARSVLGLSIAYFLEGLTVFVLAVIMIRRFAPFSWNTKIFKNYFSYCLPFLVIYPVSYLQGNLDVIFIRNFWNPAEVGFYTAAIGLSAFFKSSYGVFISIFFPKMSQLFEENKLDTIKEYLSSATRYLIIVSLPVFIAIYLFNSEIIQFILGSKFASSSPIFMLSVIGVIILTTSSPFDHLLYATGKHKLMAPIAFIGTVFLVILQLLLIPKSIFGLQAFGLGGKGAIISSLIVWFVTSAIQMYLVWKYFKIKPYFVENFRKIFVLIILIASFFYLFNLFLSKSIFSKIIFLFFINVIYYFLIKSLKILRRVDVKYFREVLAIKSILKEGIEEFK